MLELLNDINIIRDRKVVNFLFFLQYEKIERLFANVNWVNFLNQRKTLITFPHNLYKHTQNINIPSFILSLALSHIMVENFHTN
jgi:hypothetical protein